MVISNYFIDGLVWFMVFNATYNNISVISCQPVLLVEEIGVLEKTTDLSQVTDKLYHIKQQSRGRQVPPL
jgi:hypothetical protein